MRIIEREDLRKPVTAHSRAPKGSAAQVSLLQGESGHTTAFWVSRLDDSARMLTGVPCLTV